MKKYCLLSVLTLLLLINSQAAFSQIIVSSQYKHFNIPSICKIVEVIDARQEKENVGLIVDAKNKKNDTVKLDDSLDDFLLKWLERSMVESEMHYKYSLALKINYLEFNKKKYEDQTRFWLFYDIELFVKNPDSTYTSVYEGIETLEGVSGATHKKHPDGLLLTLLHWQFWNEFQNKINFIKFKKVLKENKPLSASEVHQPYRLSPILADSLKPGSYETLDELINNKPSIPSYDIKGSAMVIVDPLNANNIRTFPTALLYGYCDGEHVFINYNLLGQFIPVERLGTVFEPLGIVIKAYNNKEPRVANAASRVLSNTLISGFNSPTTIVLASGLFISLMGNSADTRLFFNTKKGVKPQKIALVRIE